MIYMLNLPVRNALLESREKRNIIKDSDPSAHDFKIKLSVLNFNKINLVMVLFIQSYKVISASKTVSKTKRQTYIGN
jgi:hypothetical protein